jgi:hypothetical protein
MNKLEQAMKDRTDLSEQKAATARDRLRNECDRLCIVIGDDL